VAELQFELWIGDAAEIRTRRVRKQKTDRQDAQLILCLLLEDRFPQIWVPSWENRDLRQLLWHRHRMVQARTRIMNQLQAVALNEGLRCKKRLWRERGRQQLEWFLLAPRASHDDATCVATAIVAAIGNGAAFQKGREFVRRSAATTAANGGVMRRPFPRPQERTSSPDGGGCDCRRTFFVKQLGSVYQN
jgi:transposase